MHSRLEVRHTLRWPRATFLLCVVFLAVAASCRPNAEVSTRATAAALPPAQQLSPDSVCDRPLNRAGVWIRGTVTSTDAFHFAVRETVEPGARGREFEFTVERCLPVESRQGERLPRSALAPGQMVVVWMQLVMRPTVPVEVVAEGVQILEPARPATRPANPPKVF